MVPPEFQWHARKVLTFRPWVTKTWDFSRTFWTFILFTAATTHYVTVYSAHTHCCIYLLSLRVQNHQKKARPNEPPQTELSRPLGYFRNVLGVSSSTTLVQSLLLKVALEPWLSLRHVSAVSPVVAVGEGAGWLQCSGGGTVPSHPWWGALHGLQTRALQDLCCGGKLGEPEGLPVRQHHRCLWFHHKVSLVCSVFGHSHIVLTFTVKTSL